MEQHKVIEYPLQARRERELQGPMPAAEAHAAAAAEGVALVRADNATGFKGVSHSNSASKPFQASLWHGGRDNYRATSRRRRRRRSPSRASSGRRALWQSSRRPRRPPWSRRR